jgi:hypothetical protein
MNKALRLPSPLRHCEARSAVAIIAMTGCRRREERSNPGAMDCHGLAASQ